MHTDEELDVDVLAAMLRADQRESGDFLAHLALKLEGALPDHTTVERKGGFFTRGKTVESVVVAFAELHFSLTREKHGAVARKSKLVRGVRLSTKELGVDEWVGELAKEIQRLAATSATARDALEKFILGG